MTILQFSFDESELILTAGEEAHIKIFTLPVPTTPSKSGDEKVFKFKGKPVALTHSHAATGVQSLPNGRILFTQSSLTSPNEVFIIRGLDSKYRSTLVYQQVSNFSGESLKSKNLDEGESFWFNGAEGIRVHGWALKPKGWKKGVKRKSSQSFCSFTGVPRVLGRTSGRRDGIPMVSKPNLHEPPRKVHVANPPSSHLC